MKQSIQRALSLWATCCVFGAMPLASHAQEMPSALNCEKDLDRAKVAYRDGDLRAVSRLIEQSCLHARLFSREKMVEGYRLLTESNLFLNDIDHADQSFMQVLRYNPLFEVDSTDPSASYDLIHLSRTYRRTPIVSVYAGGGLNYSMVNTLQHYSAFNATNDVFSTSDKKFVLGINANIGVEVPLYRNFDIVLELNYAMRSFKRADSLYVSRSVNNAKDSDPFMFGTLQFREVQHWLDVPLMIRYNHPYRKKILPYAYVGATPNILMQAALVQIVRTNAVDNRGGGQVVGSNKERIVITENTVPGDDYKSTPNSLRNTFNVSILAGVGCKFRVERNFFYVDVRYNRMMLNVVNKDNRYTQKELLYRYGYVDNDFTMDNIAITAGFIKSFYKPRKKRQYDPIRAGQLYDKQFINPLKKESEELKKTTNEEAKREVRDAIRNEEAKKKSFIDDVKAGRQSVESIKKTK